MMTVVAGILFSILPATALQAQNCTPSATQKCCGNVPVAISVGNCNVGQGGVLIAYIKQIIRFAAGLVGVGVVGVVVFGGLMYMTARGSSSQVEKAVGIIRNAIVALICFVFLTAIINFLIPGGLLTMNQNMYSPRYAHVA